MQRIENLVDLEKCCKMSIWSQKSASIQKRKSVLKFDDLAKKSEKDSISNFRTKEQSRLLERTVGTCHMTRIPTCTSFL